MQPVRSSMLVSLLASTIVEVSEKKKATESGPGAHIEAMKDGFERSLRYLEEAMAYVQKYPGAIHTVPYQLVLAAMAACPLSTDGIDLLRKMPVIFGITN